MARSSGSRGHSWSLARIRTWEHTKVSLLDIRVQEGFVKFARSRGIGLRLLRGMARSTSLPSPLRPESAKSRKLLRRFRLYDKLLKPKTRSRCRQAIWIFCPQWIRGRVLEVVVQCVSPEGHIKQSSYGVRSVVRRTGRNPSAISVATGREHFESFG